MFKHKKKKTGCETPELRKPTPPPNPNLGYQPTILTSTKPPKPPTSGSNAVKPSPVAVLPNDISTIEITCQYETPCGWCCKWDKKCDKKIEFYDNKPKRGLRANAGIYDEVIPSSDAQKIIEAVKSGKLPPLNTNNTYGLETR